MSQEELENVAKNNLFYLIWMLNETATLEAEPGSPENNAVIESFVIDARIIIEFLHGERKKDTILASNYVDGWKKPLKEGDYLYDIREKAHKMGAHLTEAGVNRADKDWPRMKILEKINEEFLEFLEEPANKISREAKEKMIKVIAKEKIMKRITAGRSSPYIQYGPRMAAGATGPTGPGPVEN